jgi:hypothetical protein
MDILTKVTISSPATNTGPDLALFPCDQIFRPKKWSFFFVSFISIFRIQAKAWPMASCIWIQFSFVISKGQENKYQNLILKMFVVSQQHIHRQQLFQIYIEMTQA